MYANVALAATFLMMQGQLNYGGFGAEVAASLGINISGIMGPELVEMTSKSRLGVDLGLIGDGNYDTPPKVLSVPSNSEFVRVYPAAALRGGGDGKGNLICVVTVSGGLRSCQIESESPKNLGFGEAARALSSQFIFKAATKGGKPIEAVVRVPIFFTGPGRKTGSFMAGTDKVGSQRIATHIAWREAPTYDQLLAVYPDRAKEKKIKGRVVMNCVFGDGGRIDHCLVINETPTGQKFGEAAQRLATLFVSAMTFPDGSPTKGATVQLPVSFNPAMLESRNVIGEPVWDRMPSPAGLYSVFPEKAKAANILKAKTIVRCVIAPTGALSECIVDSEDPPGYGFGEAALAAAPRFVAPRWSEEGVPAVGGIVRLPIVYNITPATQASVR